MGSPQVKYFCNEAFELGLYGKAIDAYQVRAEKHERFVEADCCQGLTHRDEQFGRVSGKVLQPKDRAVVSFVFPVPAGSCAVGCSVAECARRAV